MADERPIGALLFTKLPSLWDDAPLFDGKSGWWDFAPDARLTRSRAVAPARATARG